MAAILCSLCTKTLDWPTLFSDDMLLPPRHRHHWTEEKLQESADVSCYICLEIQAVWTQIKGKPKVKWSPVSCAIDKRQPGQDPLSVSISFSLASSYTHVQEIHAIQIVDNLEGMPPALIEPSTGSPGILNRVAQWLQNCRDNHPQCTKPEKLASLNDFPTRLLDLSLDRGLDHIRLIESKTHFQQNDLKCFMTLSHCWGDAEFFKLQRVNEASLLQRIPFKELPKTFRDAVLFTRDMGVRYLWIDSLCIIQDDREDWQRESVRMSLVYQNSFLNIGATGAPTSLHGLFFDKPLKKALHPIVYPREPDSTTKPYIIVSHRKLRDQFFRQPLHQRAWVLQERVLAPRMVHFTDREVFWECKNTMTGDHVPVDVSSLFHDRYGQETREKFTKKWDLGNDYWSRIFMTFSSQNLTYSSDKLVALAGIAKYAHAMAPDIYDRYLAGLWANDIQESLLWVTNSNLKPKRIDPSPAPSWSWASIHGQVQVGMKQVWGKGHHSVANLESDKITNKREGNIYGEVLEGKLCMRGPFSQIDCDDNGWILRIRPIVRQPENNEGWIYLTGILSSPNKLSSLYSPTKVKFDEFHHLTELRQNHGQDCRLFALALVYDCSKHDHSWWFWNCLILCSTQGPDFKRVGMCSFAGGSKFEEQLIVGKGFGEELVTII